MLISITTASLPAGFKDICPPWPCHSAKASMELWVQVPHAAWVCLHLWIPQLKETNTLILVLGEKDEALFGHQVYAFSLRSCSFIKPMVEPVPGSGKAAGLGCSGHSDPSPPEKSSQFPCSLLFPRGSCLQVPVLMLGTGLEWVDGAKSLLFISKIKIVVRLTFFQTCRERRAWTS